MKLTIAEQKKVENNMGLVGKVIKDKVNSINELRFYTYDDNFQIGCIGLCKAAATDNGSGCFSTYAYRLIWNEICDQLIYATRRQAKEELSETKVVLASSKKDLPMELKFDLYDALDKAKKTAVPTVQKGIQALILMSEGYTAREVGEQLGASANLVTAWVSKARIFLKTQPELLHIMRDIA